MLTPRLEAVRCSCEAPMHLVHVVPRLGGLAELHTYKCEACGTIVTRFADERVIGATTSETAGALVAKGPDISG